jgi:hypothetical protein
LSAGVLYVIYITDALAENRRNTARMKPFFRNRETILKQMGRTSLINRDAEGVREAQMNHSIHSADRSTHLKIVVVALVAGIAVAAFGISARTGADYSQTAQVVKAGKAVVVTSSSTSTVR